MKKALLILVILLAGFITYQNLTVTITDFEACVDKAGIVMESYPRQCAYNGVTYVEDISVKCTEEQRGAEVCTLDYSPVCATVNIQCITEPCDPVQQTFSNTCGACSNPLVESYVSGECIN